MSDPAMRMARTEGFREGLEAAAQWHEACAAAHEARGCEDSLTLAALNRSHALALRELEIPQPARGDG